MSTNPKTDNLTTYDLHRLDRACRPIAKAFGDGFISDVFLVGTALKPRKGQPYRDVDVRVILPDEEFDALFKDRPLAFWEMMCFAVCTHLRVETGLPIDFQIQRMSEANEKFPNAAGLRNPLGLNREYSAGGDGTPKWLTEELYTKGRGD